MNFQVFAVRNESGLPVLRAVDHIDTRVGLSLEQIQSEFQKFADDLHGKELSEPQLVFWTQALGSLGAGIGMLVAAELTDRLNGRRVVMLIDK